MGLCPFSGGAGSPSNTKSPGRGLPPYQVASSSIQPFGHNRHGPKTEVGAVFLFVGSWVPISQCRLAEAYLHTKWHLNASSRLATIEIGRKLGGGSAVFLGRGSCSPSNTVAWAEADLHTKWHLNPSSHLATADMGRKLGAVPLRGGGAGSLSNTVWPGPRPTCIPSFILIHPTI